MGIHKSKEINLLKLKDKDDNIDIFHRKDKICKLLRKMDQNKPIKLVLTTDGGNIYKCYSILHHLTTHPAGYVVYVKGSCSSAGTIIALGANEIIMDKYSHLSKIDPQSKRGESSIFYRIPDEKIGKDEYYSKMEAIVDINYLEKRIGEIIPSQKVRKRVIKEFIHSYYPHNRVFYFDECHKMGLPVRRPRYDELKYF